MAKYKLKSGLSLDGVKYEAGDSVELTKAQVEELHEILVLTPTIDSEDEGGDEDNGPNYSKMTKKQLVEELTARGAEFDPNAKNAERVAILEGLDAEGGDEE